MSIPPHPTAMRATRGFYQRMGFAEDARLPDFYGPGDSKVIYVKELAADCRQRRLR